MKTYILVLRYICNKNFGLAYENVTIDVAGPLTLEIIQKVESDTAKRLGTRNNYCRIHNVITLG
jgi:hypothetical protein